MYAIRSYYGVFEVHLIDISPGGARIRLVAPKGPLPEGAVVHFDTMLSMNGLSLNGLRSSVRWVHGEECGLMFEQELDVASSDLQVLLRNNFV